MTPNAIACWTGGLTLIAVTIAMHAVGLVWIASLLGRLLRRARRRHMSRTQLRRTGVLAVVWAGVSLAALHTSEAAVWAIAYHVIGAVDTLPEAVLYSVDSMTTRGASGLVLAEEWRLMGALEAADGMLLFGLSTAFLFAVLQHVWNLLSDAEAVEDHAPPRCPADLPSGRPDARGIA